MIRIEDIMRLIAPVKRKILLSLGRAVLQAVNNDGMTQKVQLTVLDGETITDVERFQEYGFESYPKVESQAATIFLGGNRDHGIVVCVHDRRCRPKDLQEGEVMVYTYEHESGSEHCIHLKKNREIDIKGDKLTITVDGDVSIDASGNVDVVGATINLNE